MTNPLLKEGLDELRRDRLGDLAKRRDVPLELAQSCHPGGHLKIEYLDGLVSVRCEKCFRDVVTIILSSGYGRVLSAGGNEDVRRDSPLERT